MKMDTLAGSAANDLKLAGGFCMGSRIVLAPHTALPITRFPLRFAILSGSARTELLTFSTGRNETGAPHQEKPPGIIGHNHAIILIIEANGR